MEHKDSFVVLAQERLHKKIAKEDIAWDGARVICVANDFTKFDQGAIKQMNANISLYRYRMFGAELLYLERIDEHDVSNKRRSERGAASSSTQQTFSAKLASASSDIREIYENTENFIMSLGDDITQTALKYYTAFRKSSNFVCAEVFADHVILHLKLDPKKFSFEKGFSRDVTKIGHYGTGNVQLRLKTIADFEKAKQFMRQAYDEN
jgi:predicted transport protein